ncbi:hypothetical protein SKA88_15140, partial [Enterococcus faecium]
VIPPAIFFYYSTLFDSRFKTLQQNRKVNSMIQWDEKKGLSSDSFHRWLEENRNDIENLS